MATFGFRLRFNLCGTDRLNIDAEVVPISRPGEAIAIVLRSGQTGLTIRELPRACIIGSPYPTHADALAAATFVRRRLLAWAARRQLAIDLGDDFLRSWLTPDGAAELERRIGRAVRGDLHGIDVWEIVEGRKHAFAHFAPESRLTVDGDVFLAGLQDSLDDPEPLSPGEYLAADLFALSRFEASFRGRFLTLMSGVEALLDRGDPPEPLKAFIAEFQRQALALGDTVADRLTRESLAQAIGMLAKGESIGRAGRKLARTLGSKRYLGREPEEFFAHAYRIRSQLVHAGRPDDPNVDLLGLANATFDFLGDILRAAIERRTGRSTEKPVLIRGLSGHALPGEPGAVVPTPEYKSPRRPSDQ